MNIEQLPGWAEMNSDARQAAQAEMTRQQGRCTGSPGRESIPIEIDEPE